MDTKPNHHLQSQNPLKNPKNSPKPDTFNLENTKHPATKHKRAMEKFRETIMKLAESDPNRELTATQRNLIDQQFIDFFSDFHTPDHPPYAAMIHKAITELNEKGGSSEESISNFLKKEYHDLPWAHFTLLKHHLRELCDCGEITVTRGQCYLLAGVNPDMNSSTKPRRAKVKRRRRWEWWKRRSKRQKKCGTGEENRQKKELVLVIEKQNQCNGGGAELVGKKKTRNKENVNVVEEHSLVHELPPKVTDREMEADENKNKVVDNEAHKLENGLNEGQGQHQKQEIGASSEQEKENDVIEEQNKPKKQHFEDIEEQLEEKQTELATPERPPGFDTTPIEELSESQEYQEKDFSEDKPPNSLQPPIAFLYLPINSTQLGQELNVELIKPKRPPEVEISTSGELFEKHKHEVRICGSYDQLKRLESQPARATLMDRSTESPMFEKGRQSEALCLDRPAKLTRIRVDDFYCEPPQQADCSGQQAARKMIDPLHKPMDAQQIHQEEHLVLPGPYGTTQTCVEKRLHDFQPATVTTSIDVPIDSQQFEPDEQPAFSNQRGSPELCCQQKAPKSAPLTNTACHIAPVNLDLVVQEQHAMFQNSERPSEVDLVTVEELPHMLQEGKEEQRKQRQHLRRRNSEYKPVLLANTRGPSSLQHQQQHAELSNSQGLQEVESTASFKTLETQKQQNKLYGRRKQAKSKLREMPAQEVPLILEQTVQEQLPELLNPEKALDLEPTAVEPVSEKQQKQQELGGDQEAPESLPGTTSRSFQLPTILKRLNQKEQPDLSVAERPLELGSARMEQSHQKHPLQPVLRFSRRRLEVEQTVVEKSTIVTEQRAKLRSWQKQNSCQQKSAIGSLDSTAMSQQLELGQQSQLQNPERPSEIELAKEFSQQQQQPAALEESAPPCHQNEYEQKQAACQDRGSPPKAKLETATTEEVFLHSNYPEDPQEVQQKLNKEQPKHRGRGRPPKPQPATLPSEKQQQQQPNSRGRGRPRKTDQRK
ncbi:unnamed protein product [Ilex paraguariensis]|uniref:H15 domain-containing protein n=1 Tax=Ilex paraguariensis TaxID=185542 RepID=A0ABC8SC63_9AQUA